MSLLKKPFYWECYLLHDPDWSELVAAKSEDVGDVIVLDDRPTEPPSNRPRVDRCVNVVIDGRRRRRRCGHPVSQRPGFCKRWKLLAAQSLLGHLDITGLQFDSSLLSTVIGNFWLKGIRVATSLKMADFCWIAGFLNLALFHLVKVHHRNL